MKNVYAQAVVCERILNEVDGILSAIRVADMFSIGILAGVQIDPATIPVSVGLLVSVRVREKDDKEHTTKIVLVRPDGEETVIGDPIVGKIVQQSPLAPGGWNFALQVGVLAKQFGLHCFKVVFDDEVVAETIFTLQEFVANPTPETASTGPVLKSS